MKIVGIDKTRSKSGEIVFITEPPLIPEVFEKFQELWQAGDFTSSGGSLAWSGPSHIDKEFRRQTETYLTEAENAIKAEKHRGEISKDDFLQKLSEHTGLPLL
jgi:hypothetical protein